MADKDYTVNEPEVAFDTLAAAAELQQSDFNPKQATGVVRAITDSQRNLATKVDIRELKAELKATNNRVDTLRMILLGVILPIMLVHLTLTVAMAVAMFTGAG